MRYYGSKIELLDFIYSAVDSLGISSDSTFFDLFSGTAVVGKHFKKKGFKVYGNDFLELSYAFTKCYIELNKKPSFSNIKNGGISGAEDAINYLNNLSGKSGFITKKYSPFKENDRKYLTVENAQKVDAIREKINYWKENEKINKNEYYYLLTSLLNAINLVSNVAGTYAAYLKDWDARALNELELSYPELIDNSKHNKAFKQNANEIVGDFQVDILYLDPPYNTRRYASNYFLLELIAEGWFDRKPNIYGKTGMRPYDHQKSSYSSKAKAKEALHDLINKARAKYIVMSYNNEGIISIDEINKILKEKGTTKVFSEQHKRYRSINQDGSNTNTKELLFVTKVQQ